MSDNDCGCRILWPEVVNLLPEIDYCALHKAAGQMRTALAELLRWVEKTEEYQDSTPYTIRVERARAALAAADGRA